MHIQHKELETLLDHEHIEKLDSCSHKNFSSPIVITVKMYSSAKLALDKKIMNKSIHKNKYQMPNIHSLTQLISQKLRCKLDAKTVIHYNDRFEVRL